MQLFFGGGWHVSAAECLVKRVMIMKTLGKKKKNWKTQVMVWKSCYSNSRSASDKLEGLKESMNLYEAALDGLTFGNTCITFSNLLRSKSISTYRKYMTNWQNLDHCSSIYQSSYRAESLLGSWGHQGRSWLKLVKGGVHPGQFWVTS